MAKAKNVMEGVAKFMEDAMKKPKKKATKPMGDEDAEGMEAQVVKKANPFAKKGK
jgi:hypothetical protein